MNDDYVDPTPVKRCFVLSMTTTIFGKIKEGSVEIRYVTNDPTLTPFYSK